MLWKIAFCVLSSCSEKNPLRQKQKEKKGKSVSAFPFSSSAKLRKKCTAVYGRIVLRDTDTSTAESISLRFVSLRSKVTVLRFLIRILIEILSVLVFSSSVKEVCDTRCFKKKSPYPQYRCMGYIFMRGNIPRTSALQPFRSAFSLSFVWRIGSTPYQAGRAWETASGQTLPRELPRESTRARKITRPYIAQGIRIPVYLTWLAHGILKAIRIRIPGSHTLSACVKRLTTTCASFRIICALPPASIPLSGTLCPRGIVLTMPEGSLPV